MTIFTSRWASSPHFLPSASRVPADVGVRATDEICTLQLGLRYDGMRFLRLWKIHGADPMWYAGTLSVAVRPLTNNCVVVLTYDIGSEAQELTNNAFHALLNDSSIFKIFRREDEQAVILSLSA